MKKNTVLILRTCKSDMTSYGGFKWPKKGKVQCQDWADIPECGQGLHGLLWGEGDGSLLNWEEDARWLVVKVDEDKIVDIGGDKVKFPEGYVVHCGDQKSATDYILAHGAAGRAVVGASVTAGDYGTATAGRFGTATAGEYGTATAGEYGTATAGEYGTATAGDDGTAQAGDRGTATAGHKGTATAGHKGTATAGEYGTATAGRFGTATAGRFGTATAGRFGTATAGYRGTATAGDDGTATAGDRGTATAGENGIINIKWWDEKSSRMRIATGYVGEDGIEANVPYKVENGKLVKAK